MTMMMMMLHSCFRTWIASDPHTVGQHRDDTAQPPHQPSSDSELHYTAIFLSERRSEVRTMKMDNGLRHNYIIIIIIVRIQTTVQGV
jgi:hypothetical protein